MEQPHRKEFSRMTRVAELDNLELMRARFDTHVFPRHWHDTYVIEVVEQGVDEFSCNGSTHLAPAGSIVLINPGEVHTGASAGAIPLAYRSFYPTQELLSRLCLLPDGGHSHAFSSHVIQHSRLAQRLFDAHASLEQHLYTLESHTLVLEAFIELVARYSNVRRSEEKFAFNSSAIRRTKEFIIENYSSAITLDQLSEVSGLSEFHLVRAFRKSVGLPPHEFLIAIRIEEAKQLLTRGEPVAQVSVATGFFDQSHFSKHFKRIVGVTPARYSN